MAGGGPRLLESPWTAPAVIWTSAVLMSVLASIMVTGTDPTRIPLAVTVAPPVAAVVTGLFSLRQATRAAGATA